MSSWRSAKLIEHRENFAVYQRTVIKIQSYDTNITSMFLDIIHRPVFI
jgi:hypothetical protein